VLLGKPWRTVAALLLLGIVAVHHDAIVFAEPPTLIGPVKFLPVAMALVVVIAFVMLPTGRVGPGSVLGWSGDQTGSHSHHCKNQMPFHHISPATGLLKSWVPLAAEQTINSLHYSR
jgi:hypothetical protein